MSNKDANKDNFGLGTVEATAVCEMDKNTYALQASRNSKGDVAVTGAASRQVNKDTLVKGRLSNKMELQVASKYKLNDMVNMTLSGQL
jgi:aspartate 1-decarboxylase